MLTFNVFFFPFFDRARGAKLLLAELPYLHALLLDGNPVGVSPDAVAIASRRTRSELAAAEGESVVDMGVVEDKGKPLFLF